MTEWADIVDYRDFWDVPRIFVARWRDQLFLFDCAFDDATEDYSSDYRLYLMPELGADDLAGSWAQLSAKASRAVGSVPVARVQFDPSRRAQVDASVLPPVRVPQAV